MSAPDAAALTDLLERVEKAEGADRELDALICEALFGVEVDRVGSPASWGVWSMELTRPDLDGPESVFDRLAPYTGSLDAALALVERCLPDHQWLVRQRHEGAPFGRGYFANVPTGWPGERQHFDAYGRTAPLALLAAMLKALISQETEHG